MSASGINYLFCKNISINSRGSSSSSVCRAVVMANVAVVMNVSLRVRFSYLSSEWRSYLSGQPARGCCRAEEVGSGIQEETKDDAVNGQFVLIIVACSLAKVFYIVGRVGCIVRSSNSKLEKCKSSLRMIRLLSCRSCHNSRRCQ